MKTVKRFFVTLMLLLLPGYALSGMEGKYPSFHNTPPSIKPDDELLAKSCNELEQEIAYLVPATYQYKPDFYSDPYNSGAIWGSIAITPVMQYYLPYSAFLSYQEQQRQHHAFYRIEMLRRAKAMKNCYVQ
ncbi:MAG: hypothetical protein PVG66_14915 [Chromatiales bacterium]|jgi:hypothetical protein